jgi:phenylalanine-4-hydroxylase
MDKKPTSQIYNNYTAEDFEVWKILFDRQIKNLETHVSLDFLEALVKVKFKIISISIDVALATFLVFGILYVVSSQVTVLIVFK